MQGNSCPLIDGQAMVIAIGKPQTCKTFGHFANAFVNRVISVSVAYDRVDDLTDTETILLRHQLVKANKDG